MQHGAFREKRKNGEEIADKKEVARCKELYRFAARVGVRSTSIGGGTQLLTREAKRVYLAGKAAACEGGSIKFLLRNSPTFRKKK